MFISRIPPRNGTLMKKTARLVSTSLAAGMLASAALLLPAPAAQAVPYVAEDATDDVTSPSVCVVTGGDLTWGVIERFRAYISGSIAQGSWEVADGTTYETPLFSWTNPTGELNGETGEGIITFPGGIHFSAHGGVLDTTIANPAIELKGDGTARMILDVRSNDPEGNLKIDEERVSFAKIDNVGAFDPQSGEYSFTDATGVLTAEGAPAFGDFYASGQEIDPVSLTVQFTPCSGAGGTGGNGAGDGAETAEPEVTTQVEGEAAGSTVPWLPIALGGIALVIIGVTSGMLIAGRKKTPPASQEDTE